MFRPSPSIFPEPWDALDRYMQQRAIDRLIWQYGEEKAHQICRGEDPHTNLDIAKWRALGQRRAVRT